MLAVFEVKKEISLQRGVATRYRISSTRLYVLLGMLVTMAGCTSGVRLHHDDIRALNRLYESSPWTFRQSRLGLHVLDGGAVEIVLDGEAFRKPDVAAGPLWIPIALVQELPPYFLGDEENSKNPIELQSYKVEGGLWGIVAVVPLSSFSPPSPVPPQGEQRRLQGLRIRIQMISPAFSTNLPIIIPVGQTRASIDASVTLPSGARFTSVDIGDRGDDGTELKKLTVIPAAVSGGSVRASARLTAEPAHAWDFSKVNYSLDLGIARYLLPITLITVLVTILGFIQATRFPPVDREIIELNHKRRAEVSELKHKLEPHLEKLSESRRKDIVDAMAKLIGERERERHYRFHLVQKEPNSEISQHIDSMVRKSLETVSDGKLRRDLEYDVEGPLEAIRLCDELLDNRYQRISFRRLLYLSLLTVIVILAFFTVLARSQPVQPRSQEQVTQRLTELSDFTISIEPKDPQSESVNVTLTFYPQTAAPAPQGVEDISITVDGGEGVEIDSEMKATPTDLVKLRRASGKTAWLSVPVSVTASSSLLSALSSSGVRIEKIGLTSDDIEELNRSSRVKLEFVAKGAQQASNRGTWMYRWMYRFPYDTRSIVLPLKLSKPALVSTIEIQRLPDFVGNVEAEGLSATFLPEETKYRLDRGSKDSRLIILANKGVIVKAKFQRSGFQRGYLTFGPLVFGIIGGIALGYGASRPPGNAIGVIIQGLGIIALPLGLRQAVFAAYKDLPSVFAGQAPTVFDVCFLIGWLVFAVVTVISYVKLK